MTSFAPTLLQGKVALITGGATGIGKRIAIMLGQYGASIFIASRKQERLAAAQSELSALGLNCHYCCCDVRNSEQVEAMIAAVLRQYGQLDIVINNAAGNFPAPITDISYNGFKTIVDIDLLGSYNVTKAAFEACLKRSGGNIVNITAPFQHGGASFQAHVAAAKAGVDSLTRSSAVELGQYGIRVNAVAPGAVGNTVGMARFTEASPDYGVNCPLGRAGEAADIANAVLFLVSDAAAYMTGQILCVDGGASVDLLKMGTLTAHSAD